MRMSVRDDDPGFPAYRAACASRQRIRVLLDGVERTDVVTADEERREILLLARDERGHYVIDRAKGVVITEMLRGAVVILVADEEVTHA